MEAEGLGVVKGVVRTERGVTDDPAMDEDTLEGSLVSMPEKPKYVYYAVIKPKGYVSSCAKKNPKLVVDLVPEGARVYPVGRLDKDSTGLILLTNDGRFHLEMSHPSYAQ